MAMGMSMVFVLLTVTIFAMQLSALFFRRYAHLFPEEECESPTPVEASGHAEVAIALAVAARQQRLERSA